MVLCASILLTGCTNEKSTEKIEESSILVEAIFAENGNLTLTNQFVGTVAPKESVYVIPMAQGTVTATYFEVGDTVKAGDILFEIDDTGAKMQLEQAQITYNNAKLQLDSSWESANTQKTTAIDQLKAQKTGALAQLQGAQTQYFTLKETVEDLEGQLDALKLVNNGLGSMNDAQKTDLAQQYIKDIDFTNATQTEINSALEAFLKNSISSLETSISQTNMSLNAAETSMNAALESFELLEQSLYDTVHTDLTDTKKQLDNSVNLAKLGVDSAKLALSYYDVEAPISGTIISKAVSVNGIAAASQPAYVIANDETMSVTFHVSEAVKNTLTVGADISLERNGLEYKGTITEVGNAVNQQTGLFQIKGTVYADGAALPSGVSVKLFVETYKAENKIIIPYDAVYYESDGAYVYTVKDHKAVKTSVTTGIFDDEKIEITSGIQLEDIIITSWSPRLINGALVKVNSSNEAAN